MIPPDRDGMFFIPPNRETRLGGIARLYEENFKNRLVVLVRTHHDLGPVYMESSYPARRVTRSAG